MSAQTDPVIYARHVSGEASPAADVQADIDLYHRQVADNIYGQLKSRREYLQRVTPLDSLITDYIDRGFAVVYDTISLFTVFNGDRAVFDREDQFAMLEEIHRAARKTGSRELQLFADHMAVRLMDDKTEYEAKIAGFEQVIGKAKRAGNAEWVAYTTREIWFLNFYSERYAKSFADLHRLIDALDNTDDDYPYKGQEYIWPGIAYYRFWDFDDAMRYFTKGLNYRKPQDAYLGGNYLRAWSYMAAYHHERGNLDSAAYYNRAILSSEDGRVSFQEHLDFAVCNLGRIEMQRGNYKGAIALLEAGLAYIEKDERSYEFMCGVYISLGECYLATGDVKTAASFIEKARRSIPHNRQRTKYNRLRALYALESNYYSRTGQPDKAAVYLDSALIASNRFDKLTGEHIILLGEQQLQEAEVKIKNQQIARQRNIILSGSIVLILTFAGLLIILRLYRRRNAAYKKLAQRAQEWAMPKESEAVLPEPPNVTNGKANESPTEEDLHIMALADREMTENHIYRQAGIGLDSLADHLGVHRYLLSRAISRTTGGNFSQYINGYRIKEAVRIILQTSRRELYIEELSERVGFGNRNTFSRTFKQFTGLSPIEFQKQKENEPQTGEF